MANAPNNPESAERENQMMALVADGLTKEQKDQILNCLTGAGN